MKKSLLIIIVLFLTFQVKSQQLPHFSGINLCREFYNPAAIGMNGYFSAGTFARKQWLGFEGSPFTATIFSDYTFRNEKSVVGLMYYYDQLGSFKYNTIRGVYNHKFKISKTYTLATALSPELTFLTLENNFIAADPNDPALPPPGITTNAALSFGAGLQFYSEDLVVGLSSLQLIESKMRDFNYALKRHYFIHGSYRFHLGDNFELNTIVQAKSDAASTQIDFLVSSEIVKKIIAGVGYRLYDAVFFQAGYKSKKFQVCYMYDYTTSAIRYYSKGSHEIFFRWGLKNEKENKKTLGYIPELKW